jgi:hypothetical protein
MAGLILDKRYCTNPDAAQTSLATVKFPAFYFVVRYSGRTKYSAFEEPPRDAEP